MPDNSEPTSVVWYAKSWLLGRAAFEAASYPAKCHLESGRLSSRVDISLFEPEGAGAYLGRSKVKQRLALTVLSSEANAMRAATEALNSLANELAFATGRRVTFQLGALTTAPPDVEMGSHRSIVPLETVYGNADPWFLPISYLDTLSVAIGDLDSDRGRRIHRAMGWLRRSDTSDDEYLQFAAAAFGLEEMAALLPDLPKVPSGSDAEPANAPTNSERLKAFATGSAGVSEVGWKYAGGGLRHSLFHGGIDETKESRETIANASQLVRRVVIVAIRNVLELPDDAPPPVPRLEGHMTGVRMIVESIIRTEAPKDGQYPLESLPERRMQLTKAR